MSAQRLTELLESYLTFAIETIGAVRGCLYVVDPSLLPEGRKGLFVPLGQEGPVRIGAYQAALADTATESGVNREPILVDSVAQAHLLISLRTNHVTTWTETEVASDRRPRSGLERAKTRHALCLPPGHVGGIGLAFLQGVDPGGTSEESVAALCAHLLEPSRNLANAAAGLRERKRDSIFGPADRGPPGEGLPLRQIAIQIQHELACDCVFVLRNGKPHWHLDIVQPPELAPPPAPALDIGALLPSEDTSLVFAVGGRVGSDASAAEGAAGLGPDDRLEPLATALADRLGLPGLAILVLRDKGEIFLLHRRSAAIVLDNGLEWILKSIGDGIARSRSGPLDEFRSEIGRLFSVAHNIRKQNVLGADGLTRARDDLRDLRATLRLLNIVFPRKMRQLLRQLDRELENAIDISRGISTSMTEEVLGALWKIQGSIELGRTTLEWIVREACEISCKERLLDLRVECGPGSQDELWAKHDLIRTVVADLLLNTQQSVHSGLNIPVIVRCGIEYDLAWIEVEDGGPGIPHGRMLAILAGWRRVQMPLGASAWNDQPRPGRDRGFERALAVIREHKGRIIVESGGNQIESGGCTIDTLPGGGNREGAWVRIELRARRTKADGAQHLTKREVTPT